MLKRIVFMGSPDFAVPIFNMVLSDYGIIGVVTQPDRPAGRGKQIAQCAIKKEALKNNLPIFQPDNTIHLLL